MFWWKPNERRGEGALKKNENETANGLESELKRKEKKREEWKLSTTKVNGTRKSPSKRKTESLSNGFGVTSSASPTQFQFLHSSTLPLSKSWIHACHVRV